MRRSTIQRQQACSATHAPVIAAVRERFVAADSETEAAADELGDDVGDDGTATEEDAS